MSDAIDGSQQAPLYLLTLEGLGYDFATGAGLFSFGTAEESGDEYENSDMQSWSADNLLVWAETEDGGTVTREETEVYGSDLYSAKVDRTDGVNNLWFSQDTTGLVPGQWYVFAILWRGGQTVGPQWRLWNVTQGENLQPDGTWSASPSSHTVTLGTSWVWTVIPFQFPVGHSASDTVKAVLNLPPSQDGRQIYIARARVLGDVDQEFAKPYLQLPEGGGSSHDPISGRIQVGDLTVDLVDLDDEVTAEIATDAAGSTLGSLINRKATVWAGYRGLAIADFAPIYTGRVAGLQLVDGLTTYRLTLTDNLFLLDGTIMEGSSEGAPATVRGNLVNVYWSILRDSFSTSDPVFPLDFVSTTTGSSTAPTGLGIPAALIDEDGLVAARDTWHVDTVVELELIDDEAARAFLEDEIFRVFQCFPKLDGGGRIGLKFHVPALPASSARVLDADYIVGVEKWKRDLDDHLNRFQFWGDYDPADHDFDTLLYNTETTEDTANQTETGETIRYLVESRLLSSTYDGAAIAATLAGRLRIRYLATPARVELDVNFRCRDIEQGDVVALTLPTLPNLLTGERGRAGDLVTVVGIRPRYDAGVIRLTLLDTGFARYGVISPSGTSVYLSATDQERSSFAWVSDNADQEMSNGDPGYRMV